MRRRLAASTCLLGLCGCWPALYTERVGARGRVLDGATSRPVEGAEVVVASRAWSMGRTNVAARERELRAAGGLKSWNETKASTKFDGTFEVSPSTRWYLFILMADHAIPLANVRVKAEGYAEAETPLVQVWPAGGGKRLEVGDIVLRPLGTTRR